MIAMSDCHKGFRYAKFPDLKGSSATHGDTQGRWPTLTGPQNPARSLSAIILLLGHCFLFLLSWAHTFSFNVTNRCDRSSRLQPSVHLSDWLRRSFKPCFIQQCLEPLIRESPRHQKGLPPVSRIYHHYVVDPLQPLGERCPVEVFAFSNDSACWYLCSRSPIDSSLN
jgi:hypothetical protein